MDEDVVEHLRDLLGVAVTRLVDLHAGAVGGVEALDPSRRGAQQLRPRGDDHDGVLARDGLKLHQTLAEPGLAGVHDLFQFRDDGLGLAVAHGVHAHRLTAHPVDVEAADRVDGGLPLLSRADDQQNPAAGVGADRSRAASESFEQLRDRGAGDILQRNDGEAVAGIGAAGGAGAIGRTCGAIGRRRDAIGRAFMHEHEIVGAQRALQHEEHILFRDRAARRERDRSLRAGIDDIAEAETVAEHSLGDIGHRRVFEIEREAVLRTRRGRRRVGLAGGRGRGIGRGEEGKALELLRAAIAHRLGETWLQVRVAHRVGRVGRLVGSFFQRDGRTASERERAGRRSRHAQPYRRKRKRRTQGRTRSTMENKQL